MSMNSARMFRYLDHLAGEVIAPDGSSTYEPSTFRRYARLGNVRYYGSGQIQVLVRASMDLDQRLALYHRALAIYERAILPMLSDPRITAPSKGRVDTFPRETDTPP